MLAPVDYGDPISYLALDKGVDVISRDGDRVGSVQHILADEGTDIFDGIVIDTRLGPGGLRFVDAADIAEIHEQAVLLGLSTADSYHLHKPTPNPAVLENHGVEDSEGHLEHKLRRAWDVISGRG